MAINLQKVDISLDKFQRISSGDYNAGEVRLSSEHSLTKMNNHIKYRSWNNTSISHAEVIAIKNAFVTALERGGVDANRLADIRRKLGLASADSPVDFSLRERSVKPLSRLQIREILDENAETLNRVAPGTIRTSKELYSRLHEKEYNDRKNIRDDVNRSLDTARSIVANRQIDAVQSFISGDCLFRDTKGRTNLLEDACRIREELRASIAAENRAPRADGVCKVRVETAGIVLEMSTGKSEQAFLKDLDDTILLLSSASPSSGEIEVRSDFTRVANTPEARNAFLASLAGNGLKLRAFAIHLMQSRSVADAATLASVNRLSDADVADLCRALLDLPDNIRGENVANAQSVSAILARPAVTLPTRMRATIPVLSPSAYNSALYGALTKHPENLPPDFRRVLDDYIVAMRGRFGEALVPPGAGLQHIFETGILYRMCKEASARGERYTIDTFRETMARHTLDHLTKCAVNNAIAARATARGIKDSIGSLAATVLAALPDLATRIRDAASVEERAAILSESQEIFDAALDHQRITDAFSDDIEQLARERLAAQTGLSADSLVRVCDFSSIRSQAASISTVALRELIQGKASALENARQSLRKVANAAADERLAFFKQIDELKLTARTARTLKAEILGMVKVKDVELGALGTLAKNSVNLASLKKLVQDGASVEQLKTAIQQLGVDVRNAVFWHFGEDNLGVDEVDRYCKVASLLVLDTDPELVESLRQLCDAPGNEELAAMRIDNILLSCIPDTHIENEALADDLLDGNLPPFHGKALADAGIKLPLPEPQAQALAEQIRQAPAPVSPEDIVSLVKAEA